MLNVFSFSFYRSFAFEEEKFITPAIEFADIAAFTLATRVRSCLLCKFISPEATVLNLFVILRLFCVGLDI